MARKRRHGLGDGWWGGWAVVAASFLAVIAPCTCAADDTAFPVPAGLTAAVRFWVETFTQYGYRDVIIHDRIEPGVVYDVVRDVDPGDDARVRERVQAVVDRLALDALRGPSARALFQSSAVMLDPLDRVRTHRGMREAVAEGLCAERAFRAEVRAALAAEGVPLDLSALPLVESTYHPGLTSQSGAVGLWQITADVADRYVDAAGRSDVRRDPFRATVAAARYLRDLHQQFGSWPLALTAYNHGPNGVQRAREAVGTDDVGEIARRYRGPGFGFASRNFYAEFLAARHVLRHAAQYFPEIAPRRMVAYKVKRGDTLERVAKRHGVTVPSLRATNNIRAAALRPGQVLLVRL